MEERDEIILKKIKRFKDDKVKVHVQLKSGRFYNGFVLEIEGDSIVFNDSVLGATPIYIFEINFVEKCRGFKLEEEDEKYKN